MRCFKVAVPMLAALLLVACGISVPPEKAAYVGQWNAEGMSLLITQEGRVKYNRARKGVKTSVDAPLKAFKGDDFEVGVGPMTTLFTVASPPHEVDGRWMMTVDGVELTRVD